MRKTKLLLAMLFSIGIMHAQNKTTVQDQRLIGLDTALNKLLKQWDIAGFAVAIVEKDKVIYSKGFGYRDYTAKKPVTPNTLFAIGSCTKAFTASLLGILEKDGKLGLDKKALEYLPGLHFFNDNMNNSITIRDMMSHRTGLPRHDYSWYLFTTASRDTLMQRIQYMEPSAGIREKWQYNNFMFLLQGMIAEKITGKSWEQNVREKIFTPLGMTRSNFSIADLEKDADAAVGYSLKSDTIIKRVDYYHIDAMGPAGSINSSVNEMAKWVITWINGGKFQQSEIIPAGYANGAISSQMVISGGTPDKENPDIHFSNYGLGWFLASYRGHFRVEHGGNIDGFSASTSFFPSDSIGIIVLTNQNGSSVPSVARNLIADRMLKLKYINWGGNLKQESLKARTSEKDLEKKKVSTRIKGTKPSHPLSAYEGLFVHPAYGPLEVYLRNDTLFGRSAKDSFWMRHYHYDVFEIKGFDKEDGIDTTAGGLVANFRTGVDGKIESLVLPLEPTLKPLEFIYQVKAKEISAAELEKYIGDYELSGMVTKVYLKGSILFLLVPGQPEYELIAAGNHVFKLKSLTGYSMEFELNKEGVVTGVSFVQPNGIFKATKKK